MMLSPATVRALLSNERLLAAVPKLRALTTQPPQATSKCPYCPKPRGGGGNISVSSLQRVLEALSPAELQSVKQALGSGVITIRTVDISTNSFVTRQI